ncbi:universal stress protein [Diaphorobacter sp.]|uniref:universal stress protein n=1 Tax=Diaphorobacter sp. TaxID=1934310 RepID=UPI0028A59DC1|nr:universal stress protein [Diaphorobacter sp.]
MKIQTIAALTDFSTHAEYALDRAALLAAKHQAQLILVYGNETPDPQFVSPQARLEQRARQLARRHQIDVKTRDWQPEDGGSVAERALWAAVGADLLVISRRMERDWTRFWQGSTLAYCLRHSRCPVLVVQQRAPDNYERMMISVDGSRASQHLVQYAGHLLQSAQVDLYQAPTTEQPMLSECDASTLALYKDVLPRPPANRRRLRVRDSFDARRNRVDMHLGTRDMARQLMVQQQRSHADLLVVGKLRSGWLERQTFLSQVQRLLGMVSCDVLVSTQPSRRRPQEPKARRSAFPGEQRLTA